MLNRLCANGPDAGFQDFCEENRLKKKALVVGATGVVGGNLLREILMRPDWQAVAVSRRRPDIAGDYEHIAVDLSSAAEAAAGLARLNDITHIFFSAYVQKPDPSEMVVANMALLRNLLDAIEPVSPDLRHVNLMHGTKWYGSHLGPFKTPARETDPRHMPPNFYYDQQDFIVDRQRGKNWTWSAVRPHTICGFALGNPMNLVMVMAVYAAISKELGLPLRHPGSEANANALYNVTDSRLAARASLWMATEKSAANEAFNITNGDIFRWRDLWPDVARYFGMELAPPQKIDLPVMMADKAGLWADLTRRHGLRETPYAQLVNWNFGSHVFTPPHDIILSTTKIRQRGFAEIQDTTEMFIRQFDELRDQKIIP
jgi:nucleoside-diphosphate-sugar epimerase